MEWIDVKFSDFLKERKGRYKPNDEAIKGLKRIEKIDFSGQIYLSDKPSKTDMILVKDGDLVISGINVEKGAMNIFHGDEDVVATIHYSSYTYDTNVIELEFLKHFLKSKKFKDVLKEQVPGGIKTEIKPKHLLPLQIQIPKSLDDQKKIVEHLDHLYDKLNDSSTEITHQLDLIKNLRQAFLREAMQGLLVSNETSDNKTGADLLAEIQAEKALLVKEKKIKKPKPLAPITAEELPFAIPENWTWCRLGEVIELKSGQDLTPSQYNDKGNGIPYITGASNMENDKVIINRWTETPKSIAEKGELLITCKGTIGKMTVLQIDKVHIARQLMSIRDIYSINIICYIQNILRLSISSFQERSKSLIPGIDRDLVLKEIIPLPPLEIQERIVAKLDKLMGYCDALEEQVKQSQQTNELLLQQVLREALGA